MTGLRFLWSAVLLLNTWRDVRKKEIFPKITVGAGILAAVFRLREEPVPALLPPFLPGAAFLGAAFLSRGKVGAGDGLVLCAGGICLGLPEILAVSSLGLLLGIPAGIISRRRGGEGEFPFLPCLAAAYIIERIWWN